jgi:type I restriction enzyme, S subunit
MSNVNRMPASDIFDIEGGTQPPKSEFISKPRQGYGRLLQIRDFETDAYPTYIPCSPKWRTCNATDTLIGRYGAAVGRICRGLAGYYNVALAKVVPKIDIDNTYLHYLLRSPLFQDPLIAASGRSAQAGFNKSDLTVIELPLLERTAQTVVGELLGSLDGKIAANRRMNGTLEAACRAMFRDWFVDFGPTRAKIVRQDAYLAPELWPLFPARLDSDGTPEGWRRGRLNDIANSPSRSVAPQDLDPSTPYIALEHMPRRSIAIQDWGEAEDATTTKSEFKTGEFLFGKLRPYFHKVGIAPVDGICSTDIVVVAPRQQHWSLMVLACISSDDFVEHSNLSSTGTKMPRTSWPIMRSYELALPPPQVAEAFETECRPMIERIIANVHESRTLAALRDLLLPKLMNGEIGVTTSERDAIP